MVTSSASGPDCLSVRPASGCDNDAHDGNSGTVSSRRRLVHVTTTDMSLALLLGPQLEAFAEAGYEVLGASAPGPFVREMGARGVRHLPLRHATRSFAPQHDVAALFELRTLFRALGPDIVH